MILCLLDERLVPAASTVDAKVFYLRIKGDYHRYLVKFKTNVERKDVVDSTLVAYHDMQVGVLISLHWIVSWMDIEHLSPDKICNIPSSLGK
jgi:hypothetical protein